MVDTVDSPYIVEGTTDNFKAIVIENSAQGPVLVNFWSKKAGPCLRQYPILDKLVHHYAGRVLLVNIDTENEFVFTKEYGITSVPTLKLFRDAQVVETLYGYQSEGDLQKLLDRYVAKDSDQVLLQAIEHFTEGKPAEAYQMIAEAIVEDSVNPRLPLMMCKLLKHEGRFEEAMRLLDSLPEEIRSDEEIAQYYHIIEFCLQSDMSRELDEMLEQLETVPEDISLLQQLVAHFVMHKQYEQALQHLIKIMDIDQAYDDNYAQKAMLKIFSILGHENPLVAENRLNLKRYTH